MERYSRRRWKEAAPSLEEAAEACPSLEWSYKPNPFLEFPYLPYYFLGKCHYNLQSLPDALRSFYLSSCTGEPGRDEESTEDLSSLAESCRLRIRKREKPQPHADFIDGFTALRQKDWEEVAENMWDALQAWEEDGTMTSDSAGRFRAPYLPRYRLAEALFQLGCFQEACTQLSQSKLMQLRPAGSKDEMKGMEALKPQCEAKLRDRYQDKEICQQWRCWLRQGKP